MEELLSKFQNDLGSISSEIQYLQDQSHSMSIKLKNRQVSWSCFWYRIDYVDMESHEYVLYPLRQFVGS